LAASSAQMGNRRRRRNPLRAAIISALGQANVPQTTAQLCRALPDLPLAGGGDRRYPAVHEHVYRQLVGLERTGDVVRESTAGRHVLWALPAAKTIVRQQHRDNTSAAPTTAGRMNRPAS
ncbi:hypothetical protein PP556_25305, partial [Mycobacteroides abscessus]|nr:hypothetical protein [Mycobacteroides abscessus]MDM2453190.1 hypothetical protein [Mycobacteroides abscessus]MDM2458209.1 hypothetical protein [Mycobacteroides abscessus]MDM2463222.1 hypothetical protein [Mycobacteroides abscessus]MDM2468219.1 hypothetical protein [Mycobacteroides abscessus]